MRNKLKISLVTIALMVLAGCQTTVSEQAVQMTGEEILRTFSGKTAYGHYVRSKDSWAEYYAEDGRVVFLPKRGAKLFGMWRMNGDQLCTRYFSASNDEEFCWLLFQEDGYIVDVDPENIDSKIVGAIVTHFKDGDAEGLIAE